MKRDLLSKKLVLTRETIADLDGNVMGKVKGGAQAIPPNSGTCPTGLVCPGVDSEWPCTHRIECIAGG